MLAFLVLHEAMSQKLDAKTTSSGPVPVRFLKEATTCTHSHCHNETCYARNIFSLCKVIRCGVPPNILEEPYS